MPLIILLSLEVLPVPRRASETLRLQILSLVPADGPLLRLSLSLVLLLLCLEAVAKAKAKPKAPGDNRTASGPTTTGHGMAMAVAAVKEAAADRVVDGTEAHTDGKEEAAGDGGKLRAKG